MSKITHDGLTRPGTAVHMTTVSIKGLTVHSELLMFRELNKIKIKCLTMNYI